MADDKMWALKDARILYQNSLNRGMDAVIACKNEKTTSEQLAAGAAELAHYFFEFVMRSADYYVENGSTPISTTDEKEELTVAESISERKPEADAKKKTSKKKTAKKKTGRKSNNSSSKQESDVTFETKETETNFTDDEPEIPVPTPKQLVVLKKIATAICGKGKDVSTEQVRRVSIELLEDYPRSNDEAKKIYEHILES